MLGGERTSTPIASVSAADRQREFEALALPLTNVLYATAFRMCGNAAAAEDLVQETFVCAWQKYDTYAPGTNFKAWVFRILVLYHRNQARSTARAPVPLEHPEAMSAAESVNGSPLDVATLDDWNNVYADDVEDEFKAALDRLDPDHRAILMLVTLGEFSYQECADTLGLPVGTVMSRLYRARKQLYAELSEYASKKGFLKRMPIEKGAP